MSEEKIVILDYGMGNLGSIRNMFKHIGANAVISKQVSEIEVASKLILAGVGAFDAAMARIHAMGILKILNRRVIEDHIPILGICLGMQLLTGRSEEGIQPGLGWIKGETLRFHFDETSSKLKVPHMGWNSVVFEKESKLFNEMPQMPRFYFVHAYHVVCEDEVDVVTKTPYGNNFVSSVEKENIFGTQFHPEKSHKFGMQLFRNFADLV